MRSLLTLCLLRAAAWADPGDLAPPGRASDPMEALEILDGSRGCAASLCIVPGAPDTAAAPSEPIAAKRAAPLPPRFRRAGADTWTLEIAALLRRAALRGNAVFLLYDADDKEAIKEGQYTAMYQTSVHPGRALALRMRFHPDEGFRAGHTYRLRVVQLIGGKEIELALADFTLL